METIEKLLGIYFDAVIVHGAKLDNIVQFIRTCLKTTTSQIAYAEK